MNYINKFLFSDEYGFFDKIDENKIKKIKKLNIENYTWYTTGQFSNAKNHCAAVTSTNLDLYFTKLNYFSNQDLFDEHHSRIKNGPVLSFKNKTKKILVKKGKNIKSKTHKANKIKRLKKAIDDNKILSLLLVSSLFNWHWILCVGYIEMNDESTILMIIDNWNNKIRYYIPNKKSKIVVITEFYE